MSTIKSNSLKTIIPFIDRQLCSECQLISVCNATYVNTFYDWYTGQYAAIKRILTK